MRFVSNCVEMTREQQEMWPKVGMTDCDRYGLPQPSQCPLSSLSTIGC